MPRGLRVADVGCGTGLLTLTLAGVAETVEAVDASERMVRLAREKLRHAGAENVSAARERREAAVRRRCVRRDLRVSPSPASVRPADALAELGRTVSPGGRVVLVELEPHGLRALRAVTGAHHLGLPRETARAGLRRAGFSAARFSAFAPTASPGLRGNALATYIVDAVRDSAHGRKEIA